MVLNIVEGVTEWFIDCQVTTQDTGGKISIMDVLCTERIVSYFFPWFYTWQKALLNGLHIAK